ncbi:hypothetical protein [Streptomyces sp. NPDC048419]|uniref:hypothetical protein n=1 Tax=Streptomyces sp. NPDC048419 TaxID=3365547 RepID=UPI003718BD8F
MLDQALRLEQISGPLDRCTAAVSREELREAALQAQCAIEGAVDAEYRAYLGLPASASGRTGSRHSAACRTAKSRAAEGQSAISMLLRRAAAGAGLALLLAGHWVRSLEGRPYVGDALLTAGLLIGAMAVGAAVGDVIWLVMEVRKSSAGGNAASGTADPEVTKAREAWEAALLERGMLPFLLGRLEKARTGERGDRAER